MPLHLLRQRTGAERIDSYSRLVIRPLGDNFATDLGHVMSHDLADGICHLHYIRTPLFKKQHFVGTNLYYYRSRVPEICPQNLTISSQAVPIQQRSSRRFLRAYMLPNRDLCATAFCVCALFFTRKKSS